MKISVHWTVLLLGVLVVAPVAAETALRIYASCVTKRDRLFRSDTLTGWSNAPSLLTTRINAAGPPAKSGASELIRTANGSLHKILTHDTGF
jgi:hypothetical protein